MQDAEHSLHDLTVPQAAIAGQRPVLLILLTLQGSGLQRPECLHLAPCWGGSKHQRPERHGKLRAATCTGRTGQTRPTLTCCVASVAPAPAAEGPVTGSGSRTSSVSRQRTACPGLAQASGEQSVCHIKANALSSSTPRSDSLLPPPPAVSMFET